MPPRRLGAVCCKDIYAASVSGWFRGFREMVSSAGFRPVFALFWRSMMGRQLSWLRSNQVCGNKNINKANNLTANGTWAAAVGSSRPLDVLPNRPRRPDEQQRAERGGDRGRQQRITHRVDAIVVLQ